MPALTGFCVKNYFDQIDVFDIEAHQTKRRVCVAEPHPASGGVVIDAELVAGGNGLMPQPDQVVQFLQPRQHAAFERV